MNNEAEITERVRLLNDKYEAIGQDMLSYLDGLLYAEVTNYWDYIHTDTLLTLQKPKTPFPDELVFIIYHQITELYFRLTLHEMEQVCLGNNRDNEFLTERTRRMNSYFEALTKSYDIMVNGMEPEQFLKFRMSLLPASGFQSAQYRMIEIYATRFEQLIDKEKREELKDKPFSIQFEHIYWKKGATELASGKKTLTLKQFEKKYTAELINLAEKSSGRTLYDIWETKRSEGTVSDEFKHQLRELDLNVNVRWPLSHYKSAVKYLQKSPTDIKATGGTNWQKYLPPVRQKRIFYPTLWTSEELENWGKFH
jgi:tryptophan 2,3-dioxygenase